MYARMLWREEKDAVRLEGKNTRGVGNTYNLYHIYQNFINITINRPGKETNCEYKEWNQLYTN